MRTIDHIVKSGIIEKACKTLAGDLADDLQQHLYLTFCSMPEAKLLVIWQNNFEFYVFRCVLNAMHENSSFKRWHSSPRELRLDDTYLVNLEAKPHDIHSQIDAANKLEKVNAKLDKLYWYDRDLFKLYLKEGSYRAVERKVGILHDSVWKTVKKVREELKRHIDEDIDSSSQ